MKILPIIDRLKATCPSLLRNGEYYIYPFGSIPTLETNSQMPLVEVDEQSHQPQPNSLANSRVQHRVGERLAIYIASPLVVGTTETLDNVRTEIRNAILGWRPTGNDYGPYVYVGGQRIKRDEGATGMSWWIEIFETMTTIYHDYQ